MKLKTLRIAGLIAMLFCSFKLGTIHQQTKYFERITVCVRAPDNVDLQEFYGHGFREENLTHTIWNHARGHNATIYLDCIFKDMYRDE